MEKGGMQMAEVNERYLQVIFSKYAGEVIYTIPGGTGPAAPPCGTSTCGPLG